MTEPIATIRQDVTAYYTDRLARHGPTPAGVDWKDEASQLLRFAQLYRLLPPDSAASVLDVGCGYAAWLPYARAQGWRGHYTGVDYAPAQLAGAKNYIESRLPLERQYSLTTAADPLPMADYAIASGIFNVKLASPASVWHDYVLAQLDLIYAASRQGFAFNCLTDMVDWRRDDLYYADPAALFALCRQRYGRHIALLHDYGLYEFTIIVRRTGGA